MKSVTNSNFKTTWYSNRKPPVAPTGHHLPVMILAKFLISICNERQLFGEQSCIVVGSTRPKAVYEKYKKSVLRMAGL
jgi:hypothetical protein